MKKKLRNTLMAIAVTSTAGAALAQVTNPKTSLPDITVLAKDFNAPNSLNVALGGPSNAYGADVLLNAPPYQDVPNRAYYRISVPRGRGGTYQLDVEYAAMVSRPVTINVNGKNLPNSLSATTGCWQPTCQAIHPQGSVTLKPGINSLTVTRDSVFPHIRKFIFRSPKGPNPN